MAALHLLPRELVHLLASRPSLPSSGPYNGLRLSSLLFAQQLPRFSSDYRRISLDSETARDFDRPSEGYEYPSIAGEQQSFLDEASFIEEDEADYRFKIPAPSSQASTPSFSTTVETEDLVPQMHMALGARALSRAKLNPNSAVLSIPQMHQVAMNNSANCLKRGDLDSALAWFIDAPVVPIAFSNQYARIATLTYDLRDRLMQERSNNIALLMSFATSCASKGFPRCLYRIVPHIARFSTYERLKPFWNDLCQQARRSFKLYRPASSMPLLERTLLQVGNRVIRNLYLSENYLDALRFLKDIRSQERRHADPSVSAVEFDTYRIFMEELKRHNTHPALYSEVESLCQTDYGTLQVASPLAEEEIRQETTTSASLDAPGEYEARASRLEPTAKLLTPKTEYNRLSGLVMRGETIDRQVLSNFSKLCIANDSSYLARSLARTMAMSSSEKESRLLINEMRQGELPTARRLSSFIDTCVRSRQQQTAANLGRWMEKQGMRFRGLWIIARMHRLVRQGDERAARDALQLYKDNYLSNGLPEPIIRYFETIEDRGQERREVQDSFLALAEPGSNQSDDLATLTEDQLVQERSRIPASSHSIAMAIQAWLILNPHESNITETYQSFLSVSYAVDEDFRTPSQLMPDQVTFGVFLQNLSRNGKHTQAMRVLEDMKKRGIMPNQHNWDTVIGAFAKAGSHQVVANVISRMENAQGRFQQQDHQASGYEAEVTTSETPPSNYTMKPFAVTERQYDPELGDINRLLEGFQFYPPTLVTYTTTIRGFAIAGRLDKAKYYMKKMFTARDLDGDLLYRFGKSSHAEKVLDIITQMSNLADVGRKVSQRREYSKVR